MKASFFALLVFSTFLTFAGDTTFYDKNYHKVASFDKCHLYEIESPDPADSTVHILESFYRSGQIKARSVVSYKNNISYFNGGLTEAWYENGQLERRFFMKGPVKLHGEVLSYHKNGNIRRKDFYEDGVLLRGACFNEDGTETPHSDFIIPASFPGGNNALMGYLLKNLKYPAKANKQGLGGRVLVKFLIDTDGSIKDISIERSIHDLLDKEALNVVRKMPKWIPRIYDGELVPSYFLLPVSFVADGN